MLNFMFGNSCNQDSLVTKSGIGVVTRSQRKKMMKVKRPKTEKFKKSLAYRGPKRWNSLLVEIHQVEDKIMFRRLARDWVSQKAQKAQIAQSVQLVL